MKTNKVVLVLCSLNSITKETAIVAMILGRPSPDPGLGPSIELCSRHAPGLVDLSRIGKTLARQRIAAKEPPPALLQVEPAGPFGNEDLVDAGMLGQPDVSLRAQMAGQVISN